MRVTFRILKNSWFILGLFLVRKSAVLFEKKNLQRWCGKCLKLKKNTQFLQQDILLQQTHVNLFQVENGAEIQYRTGWNHRNQLFQGR